MMKKLTFLFFISFVLLLLSLSGCDDSGSSTRYVYSDECPACTGDDSNDSDTFHYELPPITDYRLDMPAGIPDSNRNYFGAAVAASADGRVCRWGPHDDYEYKGAVCIYTAGTARIGQLIRPYPATNLNHLYFGGCLAMSADGSVLVVSYGPSYTNNFYVYRYDGENWSQTQMPRISGHALDISADGTVIASGFTYYDSGDGDTSGKIAIFRFVDNEWVYEAGFKPYNAVYVYGGGITFSLDLSDDGTALVVGSTQQSEPYSGIIHLISHDGASWKTVALQGSYKGLGSSVSISPDKNLIIAGARYHHNYVENNSNMGLCCVYTRCADDSWELLEITPPFGNDYFNYDFGWKVFCSANDSFFVSAKRYILANANPIGDSSSAFYFSYLYRRQGNSWVRERVLFPSGMIGDWFGCSYAKMADDIVLIGAHSSFYIPDFINMVGSVYLYGL